MTTTELRTPVLPGWAAVPGFALLGVLAGIAAKAADESGIDWAGDLGTYPAAWVLAVALVGRFAPTLPSAAVRAAVFFAAMTVAYYAWAAAVLGFGWSPQLVPWLVLSITAVAGAAVAAWWGTRRSGPFAGALMAMSDLAARPVQAGVDVVVAALLTVLIPRHRGTRLWALVLVLPLTGLAASLLQRLYQIVG
jgi:hypothetical protein